jgi:hypothetical protein
VLGDVSVEGDVDELGRAHARVVLQIPSDNLTVRRQRLAHGERSPAVVHARREMQDEQRPAEEQRQYHVPEA